MRQFLGFTLIELIAVLVLVGIVGVTVSTRFQDDDRFQVQASRDQLVAALFFAQQKALYRSGIVQLSTHDNTIDVTLDGASISADSLTFPMLLPAQISLTAADFIYNRLGETSANSIAVQHASGALATVTVSDSGYAY